MVQIVNLNTAASDLSTKSSINSAQENLHRKFKYFGTKHLEFRQKCIGLLPQIYKEKIYLNKGFSSVFEYAAKLAGLSHEQVSRALNLHERFEDLPALKSLLENGEVSINKLARIASIASAENQEQLADTVRVLSKSALETLVRNIRSTAETGTRQDSLQKPLIELESVPGHNSCEQRKYDYEKSFENEYASPGKLLNLKLTGKNLEKLLELQNKGIDINEIIETALQDRENKIADDKAETTPKKTNSRYIPAKVKKIINAEQGAKCSTPNCKNPAQIIHHEIPFAMVKTHDPRNLQKLCKAHHELKHSINIKFYALKKRALDSS